MLCQDETGRPGRAGEMRAEVLTHQARTGRFPPEPRTAPESPAVGSRRGEKPARLTR